MAAVPGLTLAYLTSNLVLSLSLFSSRRLSLSLPLSRRLSSPSFPSTWKELPGGDRKIEIVPTDTCTVHFSRYISHSVTRRSDGSLYEYSLILKAESRHASVRIFVIYILDKKIHDFFVNFI